MESFTTVRGANWPLGNAQAIQLHCGKTGWPCRLQNCEKTKKRKPRLNKRGEQAG
jgi:hypothetical protein